MECTAYCTGLSVVRIYHRKGVRAKSDADNAEVAHYIQNALPQSKPMRRGQIHMTAIKQTVCEACYSCHYTGKQKRYCEQSEYYKRRDELFVPEPDINKDSQHN